MAFGASQTEGKIVPRDQAYPAQLERVLRSQGHDVTVTNAGVSGDNSADLLRRLPSAIPPGTDIVLLQPGTNDCRRRLVTPEEAFRSNITSILQELKARRVLVLVLGGGCYEHVQSELPAQLGLAYYGLLNQGLKAYPRPDGQHYTVEGYARLAQLLAPHVGQLVEQARKKPQ